MTKKTTYLLGLLIMALGISLMIKSELGVSSFDAFNVGLNSQFGLTAGIWFMISGIILIFINAYLLKSRPSISSFLSSILSGLFIDFWLAVIQIRVNSYVYQYSLLILGLILYSLGIALYISADLAKGPIDNFMLAVSKVSGKSISFSKTVNELLFLFLAFIVKGPIGVGTVVTALTSGFLIQFFNEQIIRSARAKS